MARRQPRQHELPLDRQQQQSPLLAARLVVDLERAHGQHRGPPPELRLQRLLRRPALGQQPRARYPDTHVNQGDRESIGQELQVVGHLHRVGVGVAGRQEVNVIN
jgi:hypothetical protein